ncbi:MAG: hypothetical protein GWM92_01665 [Gemmatimonadetes bacterium]|nr:type II toxin-antitoxin system VapC family toxin [Gemmatimonadota bacterium]NIR77187.1 type II toxin-antitoxin system VapC family toxin [Gemmatimonadota bacterium]NIT85703.1 type II toxin-antitoxin system VapC family toxin [Gemmatimonadota bacterium]NIU29533.1 type II toxin-antitoxin system VapC family toxin [Gemmatimonadota bacterium]NIU34580.1 hypothetical protein [Gemmatimonadota bacterium]
MEAKPITSEDTSFLVDLLREGRAGSTGPATGLPQDELEDEFAPGYGKLLAATRRSGEPIGTMGLLIAAAAVIGDAPLVTRNARDFRRIPGLELIEYG